MCKKVSIFLLLLLVWMPLTAQNESQLRPFTVVIDAGHGGKDPGAVGKKSREKDLNLQVSLLAGKRISEAFPDVRVLYTRTTDEYITLQGRADFVNKNNADLFICIHTNAVDNKNAQGAEVFVLGTEKMDQNLDVAMRENAVIKLESDYQTQYQGFDPNSIDSYIMFELMQNRYMDQSLRFAELIQQQFVDSLHRVDRGVRQAAFWVLLKSACPSVLVEIGFITNPDEEKYLNSAQGQDDLARSIENAFSSFYRKPTLPPAPVIEEPVVEKEVEKVVENEMVTKTKKENHKAVKKTIYAVQIAARRQPLAASDPALKGLKCEYFEKDGWYKYYYGASEDREAVRQIMQDLRAEFPDCFIIKL